MICIYGRLTLFGNRPRHFVVVVVGVFFGSRIRPFFLSVLQDLRYDTGSDYISTIRRKPPSAFLFYICIKSHSPSTRL